MHYRSVKTSIHSCLLLAFFLSLHLTSGMASCSEIYVSENLSNKYYVDNQRVFLLFKLINWWYDCLPKDNYLFCGKSIKCTNLGNACIEYSPSRSALKISVQKGLADQLSIFKACGNCSGPSSLHGTWLNKKYFGKGSIKVVTNLNQFTFLDIDRNQARILKSIEKDIVFVVKGYVRGLTNDGKIALHDTGAILKKCPDNTNENGGTFPIDVTIKINSTDEIIAHYAAIWSD